MIQKIYGIFDKKAAAYLQPFFSTNSATALRSIENELRNPSSNLGNFSSDYRLDCLGCFDDVSGQLEYEPSVVEELAALMPEADNGMA